MNPTSGEVGGAPCEPLSSDRLAVEASNAPGEGFEHLEADPGMAVEK